jgi:carotenoid cleavage dioxygenase-like enzyme
MALDAGKVAVVEQFLKESFPGCPIYHWFDGDRGAGLYRIDDEAGTRMRHRIVVSRAFFDDHAAAELVSALQTNNLISTIKNAGTRRVIVRSQELAVEEGM